MKKHNLGIFMIITKEFKKVEGKEKLFKEIMLFADQTIVKDDTTQLDKLMMTLEKDQTMKLHDKKDYFAQDRDLRLINYQQGNIAKDRKTLDKFLKNFYEQ
jgi:hypothetical protein